MQTLRRQLCITCGICMSPLALIQRTFVQSASEFQKVELTGEAYTLHNNYLLTIASVALPHFFLLLSET